MKALPPTFSVVALARPVVAQTMEPSDFQITAEERAAVIEDSIAKLNEIYIFPEAAKKMESAVRMRVAKGEYNATTSAGELARKLTADLREVSQDKHLRVDYFPEGVPEPSSHSPSEVKAWREGLANINFAYDKVERMEGNVGYIEIRGFVPQSESAVTASAAMSFVAYTDALIIDLRRNTGGDPGMVAYVLSYFFDEPTHLNDVYERVGDKTSVSWTMSYVPGPRFGGHKPIYVLISHETFSGGEDFAYSLKNLKRATLVGEVTGGGAHPVRPVKVGEHFAMLMPFARSISPITGTNWEGTGVVPDVATPASAALEAAYTMALAKIIETTTNAARKQQLQQFLDENKGKEKVS